MKDKKLNNQPLAYEATPELDDELLDAVTGGAKLPELKIPTHSTPEEYSASKKSTIAPYGTPEWWPEYSAYMASIAPSTTPSSEDNP